MWEAELQMKQQTGNCSAAVLVLLNAFVLGSNVLHVYLNPPKTILSD